MQKVATLTLLGLLAVPPGTSAAVDLNGRWLVDGGFPVIVTITQTGSALSIPYNVPFTGTVGATDANGFTSYSVSWTDGTNSAGFGGRVMPSGNLFDGRGGAYFPPSPPSAGAVIATRCSCFDNNSVNGDGCDAQCQVEPCWTCVGDPSVCTPTPDGGACDDLSPCTTGEACTAGVCGGGTPQAPCFDLNGPWTRHRAVPALGIGSNTYTTISQRGTDLRIDSYVGAIDPITGAIDVRAPNLNLFCASFDTLLGSVAADGLSYALSGYLELPQPFAPDHCDSFAQTELGDHCGNGMFEGTEACDDGNLTDGDGCSALCAVEQCWACSGTPSTCTPVGGGSCDDANGCTINDTCAGDGSCAGTPNTGATCDDGSVCTAGDGCTAAGSCSGTPVDCGTCQTCNEAFGGCIVDIGAQCDDGDACTSGDTCLGDASCAGSPLMCEPCFVCGGELGCVLEPQATCKASTAPDKSIVSIKNSGDDTKDAFNWRWKKGADTDLSELGDPTSQDVTVCMYDESTAIPSLLFRATMPASTVWTSTSAGFRYKDANASADGVLVASLKSGVGGKASAKVKGKGVHLSNRPYGIPAPTLPLPLRIQLHGPNGLCLETRHDASTVLKNDAASGVFKARGAP